MVVTRQQRLVKSYQDVAIGKYEIKTKEVDKLRTIEMGERDKSSKISSLIKSLLTKFPQYRMELACLDVTVDTML